MSRIQTKTKYKPSITTENFPSTSSSRAKSYNLYSNLAVGRKPRTGAGVVLNIHVGQTSLVVASQD